MSAALLEMLLELDPEDHLEGSELLAFDYLALDEQELFDEVINDVSDKHPGREVLLLWSAFRRDGRLPERPSPAAQARELWLQTENLWVLWPGFIDALRAAR